MKFLKFAAALPILACLVQPVPASAQSWPSKPLQMIVPQGAGGSTDNIARLVAQVLGERLGQSVVIDNRQVPAACWVLPQRPRLRPTATRC